MESPFQMNCSTHTKCVSCIGSKHLPSGNNCIKRVERFPIGPFPKKQFFPPQLNIYCKYFAECSWMSVAGLPGIPICNSRGTNGKVNRSHSVVLLDKSKMACGYSCHVVRPALLPVCPVLHCSLLLWLVDLQAKSQGRRWGCNLETGEQPYCYSDWVFQPQASEGADEGMKDQVKMWVLTWHFTACLLFPW